MTDAMKKAVEALRELVAHVAHWERAGIDTIPLTRSRAALAALESEGEPAGDWVMVPREPTDEMVDATYHGQPIADIWRDMLAAAPQAQPSTEGDAQSRAMFIARLENARTNGEPTMAVSDVLALLDDCDMLAARDAAMAQQSNGGA